MGNLRLFACAVGLLFSAVMAVAAGARADPPRKGIALGDLTFDHDPQSWHIAPGGDGLVATCVQEDCRGAVIDIGRRDGEAGCTREAMIAEAERLFPAQGRAYANIYPAGRFALVLAARHDGPTLSSPEYIHGCVAWQGSDYRFAMRPETVGTQSWIGGALHYLVSRAAAPAARVEQLHIGGIDVHVSTEVWTIPDGAEGKRVVLTCRMPTCRKPGLTAVLTVRHPQQPCPVPDDGGGMGKEADTRVEILPPNARDGLEITVSETFLGCRNYMPPGFEACAVHGGRSYHLSTFVPVDCGSSIDRIPRDVLIGLMRDARIADK